MNPITVVVNLSWERLFHLIVKRNYVCYRLALKLIFLKKHSDIITHSCYIQWVLNVKKQLSSTKPPHHL